MPTINTVFGAFWKQHVKWWFFGSGATIVVVLWILLSLSRIKGKPTFVIVSFVRLSLSLFNLHIGGPLCRLGMHHLCDFGDGVARPICGVVCPIQERSLNQVEARANPRYSASSTSTSRSLFGRSSEGLNPDSNPRLLVAAGVHLWLAARVQDGHVCNQTGCRASPEGVSLHVASHLGRLGHIL